MFGWLFRSKRRPTGAAKRNARRVQPPPARAKRSRTSKARYRDQPAPLTWNDPDQDFITRYGDPYDG